MGRISKVYAYNLQRKLRGDYKTYLLRSRSSVAMIMDVCVLLTTVDTS